MSNQSILIEYIPYESVDAAKIRVKRIFENSRIETDETNFDYYFSQYNNVCSDFQYLYFLTEHKFGVCKLYYEFIFNSDKIWIKSFKYLEYWNADLKFPLNYPTKIGFSFIKKYDNQFMYIKLFFIENINLFQDDTLPFAIQPVIQYVKNVWTKVNKIGSNEEFTEMLELEKYPIDKGNMILDIVLNMHTDYQLFSEIKRKSLLYIHDTLEKLMEKEHLDKVWSYKPHIAGIIACTDEVKCYGKNQFSFIILFNKYVPNFTAACIVSFHFEINENSIIAITPKLDVSVSNIDPMEFDHAININNLYLIPKIIEDKIFKFGLEKN